jgi:hypothetical protein
VSPTWRIVAVGAVIGALVVAFGAPGGAGTPPGGPVEPHDPRHVEVADFDEAPAPPGHQLAPAVADKVAHARRARWVELSVGEIIAAVRSGRVDLELFDDVVIPLAGRGAPEPGEGGTATWSGDGPSGSYATLTFDGEQVHGAVAVGGTRYDIQPVTGRTHLIVEEGRLFPDEVHSPHADDEAGTAPPPPAGQDESSSAATPPPAAVNDHGVPVIRLLTWYDTAARNYYGGDAAAQSELAATINEMNAAYERSGIHQLVESAGIEYVAYVGTGQAGTELDRLTWNDGHLDAVHARRDATEADLVGLVTHLTDGCGIAWLPPIPPSNVTAPFGFSVSDRACARSNLTYAHEVAHNMGAGHGGGDGAGTFAYSNGHRDTVQGFRTIMAYNSSSCPGGYCERVAHFSSPTVLYEGWPTGSPNKDNARTLNETAAAVSAYRGPPPPPVPSRFHAVSPARILDSRAAFQEGPFSTPWNAGTTREVTVAGAKGVPVDAEAVVLNVTATGTTAGSYLSIWPKGEARPTVSSLNWSAGWTIPNSVTVKVGVGGRVNVYNNLGLVDVVIDVVGYYDADSGAGFTSLSPARILDSRAAVQEGPFSTPWNAGTTREVTVAGAKGVPADAEAVVLNVTATGTTAGSYLSIWPKGEARPTVSSLNWSAGWTIPNSVTVKVGAGGRVNVYNNLGLVDVVIDLVGYFETGSGSSFHSVSPVRIQDSRAAFQVGPYTSPWGPGTARDVTVAGVEHLPAEAEAVLLNVTVTGTTATSYLSTWPKGELQPTVSSLNWVSGWTIPNAVTARAGTGGQVRVYNNLGSAHVIADASGWYG